MARLDLAEPPPIVDAPALTGRTVLKAGAAAAIVLAIGASAAAVWPRAPIAPAVPMRLRMELGASRPVVVTNVPAISADGTLLAFVGRTAGNDASVNYLFVRSLDRLEAQQLDGTEGALAPFFSPDGKWIAFFSNGQLRKVSTTGGRVFAICDAPVARGGSWSADESHRTAASSECRRSAGLPSSS